MGIKVLVISHNVFSMTSNMGRTLANFFKGLMDVDVAQLFFHSEIPTTDMCKNYFRITDFDIIRKRKKDIGDIFTEKDINKELKSEKDSREIQSKIYKKGRKRKPYMYIGRNLIWATKKWKNNNLLKWIEDFDPDVIFFASGDYVFSYKIAEDISRRYNIPIITYVCDDYYFLKRKSVSPLDYFNRMHYKSYLRKYFKNNKRIVTICKKLAKDYAIEFGTESEFIMTTSDIRPSQVKKNNDKVKISYLGNLGYNRHKTLVDIGRCVKKLTQGNICVDVYSAENRQEIIECLSTDNGICFKGEIHYDEVIRVMNDSDILIHTESMDSENKIKVKYSVSTKIADSLSSGVCLLAYGPEDVASIEYLMEHDCACVVTDTNMLDVKLDELINSKELRREYANKALATADKYHNINKNSMKIKEIIKEAIKR